MTTVMVVEDERIVALHLKQLLSKMGYDVPSVVASGDNALCPLTASPPDVVLMDIHIEGAIDGIETARRIPAELHIPVVYLSAYADEATLARARATTPYGYLLKPFSERELHATIQMVLERRRADLALHDSERRLERLVAERTAELVAANRELVEQTTERLKSERELRQTQKMEAIGQLTGAVAHELNNLLTVIFGNLDAILGNPADRVHVIASVDGATRAVQKGVRLIKQLLVFARREVMFPKVVDPNDLITEFLGLIARGAPENIDLVTRLDPSVHRCRVDPTQFTAAILNLVVNARDAIAGHGRIVIETMNVALSAEELSANPEMAPGSYVMVVVSDTGGGIRPEILPRVFDPFFTTKEVGKGSGLGLSQVYGFAKESGGYVKIDSAVGAGTRVSLYLPRSTDSLVEDEPTSEAVPPRPMPVAPTVLIVEDNELVLEMTVKGLAGLGYRLLTARDAAAALQILQGSESVDILFSDVVMPGSMNGVQLAADARRLRPAIKVLLTSGYAEMALVADHGLGEDMPLLEKPYRPHELAARFHAILSAA